MNTSVENMSKRQSITKLRAAMAFSKCGYCESFFNGNESNMQQCRGQKGPSLDDKIDCFRYNNIVFVVVILVVSNNNYFIYKN